MPRRGSPSTSTGADQRRRRAGDVASDGAQSGPAAVLAVLGVTADELRPEWRDGVERLAAERDRLYDELIRARGRIATLERLADEDALTPVANRRAFVRQLSRMIGFSHRYGVAASVVYFDINNMKQINDAYGHLAGDAALRHVATVLRDNTRSSDVVGRLGGDEFGVILAQTDEAQAHAKAASLAAAIADKPLLWEGLPITLSAAYGVHAFSGSDDPQQAMEAADRAMYRQKRAAVPANI